jgi:lipopolysaccharide/colanic/teichoic acid biosynthesis glycosyltransferase
LDTLPGLTGLWQVSGRSDVEFDDRVRLDVQYIERRGFLFDLMIIWQTFGSVITSRGAY